MDDGSNTEAERWLNAAAKLLASGDFHGTRTFAIRARESAPVLADRILSVTDTLLTAQGNPRDWYGILQLVPLTQSMEVVESQYRKLAIMLNPGWNTHSFAYQAFRLVAEAWEVLSNPSKKLISDDELRFLQFGHVNPLGQQHYQHQQPQLQQPSPRNNYDGYAALEGEQLGLNNYSAGSNWTRQTGLPQPSQINKTGSVGANHISRPEPTRSSHTNRSEPIGASQINQTEYSRIEPTQSGQINHSATPAPTKEHSQTEPTGATRSEGSTFWTACPHCYSQFEYPKVYGNRTLRCQTKDCRKAFQAVVIPFPPVQTEPSGVSWNTYLTWASQSTESAGPTFWTACPYCYVLYEYPKVYEDYTLRCQAKNCRRAYHAVVIPSPPVNGNDTNFRCWGFFPIACNGNFSSWSPISTNFACPDNKNAGKQKITKKSAPRVFMMNKIHMWRYLIRV
ncbi:uncharacterized protein LOC120160565 [Hibiscus syriacus]|uniref:uncharacterized protein LOC120160565 n=1 Tax=Hibiscus syriacus TaxID=106335 RepID=UPI00192128AD|nr:uncharacterized protein LOC120160565 [Hibiscus syriacus]